MKAEKTCRGDLLRHGPGQWASGFFFSGKLSAKETGAFHHEGVPIRGLFEKSTKTFRSAPDFWRAFRRILRGAPFSGGMRTGSVTIIITPALISMNEGPGEIGREQTAGSTAGYILNVKRPKSSNAPAFW